MESRYVCTAEVITSPLACLPQIAEGYTEKVCGAAVREVDHHIERIQCRDFCDERFINANKRATDGGLVECLLDVPLAKVGAVDQTSQRLDHEFVIVLSNLPAYKVRNEIR